MEDYRDDIIYPYVFERALEDVVHRSYWYDNMTPENFDELVDEFARKYPEAWGKIKNKENSASVYLRSSRPDSAASVLFDVFDHVYGRYESIAPFEGWFEVGAVYREPFTEENFSNRDEYNKAFTHFRFNGRPGYYAALIALVYMDDLVKAREYAEATADKFPDTKYGMLCSEIVRYCDRYSMEVRDGE
jgi:hypothetical protein